jgi:cyclic pyranopterin monophosphate synthase
MPDFTHMDDKGRVRMVDVGDKPSSHRMAVAQARLSMTPDTFDKIINNRGRKGNALETARIAGMMAAKKTPDLIPLCHPIRIRHVQIDFYPNADTHSIGIGAAVRAFDQTGVEMEALTAVSVAGLTLYDMCKSHDRAMTLSDIRLLKKSGGKSGTYVRESGDRSIPLPNESPERQA